MLPLTEPQRALVTRYIPLAAFLAGEFARARPRVASAIDAQAVAFLALVETAGRFRPDGPQKFPNHAGNRIKWAMKEAARRYRPMGFRKAYLAASRPAHVALDEARDRPDDADPAAEVDAADAFAARVAKLPPTHLMVVCRMYVADEDQAAIAARMGRSDNTVSRLHREALAMLGGRGEESRAARNEYERSRRKARRAATPKEVQVTP